MSYHIEDEPRPGALGQIVVHPMWPLLAIMFGGAGVSWPWFMLNAAAVGSPTRRREIALAAGGFAGSFALILVIFALLRAKLLNEVSVRYALLVLTVWKLAVSYWLFTLQSRSFHLFQYFGGEVKNGLIVVIAGYFLASRVFAELPTFWMLIAR